MTIYPVKPDGSVVTEMFARLEMIEMAELMVGDVGSCANYALTLDVAERFIARTLNLSTICCSSEYQSGTLPGGLNRNMIVTNVTHPNYPDFLMTLTISLSNERLDIEMPGTPKILGPYNISYYPDKPKVDIVLNNWPWITDEQPGLGYGDTYLQAFFWTSTILDVPGVATVRDFGQDFELSSTNANVDFRINFLQVINYDGVDMYSPVNEILPLDFFDITNFSFPGIITMCDNYRQPVVPRYQTMSWDPTLSAVFIPPQEPESPQTKKSNKTVAIAAGVSVGAVVLISATLAVLFTQVPMFKSLLRR